MTYLAPRQGLFAIIILISFFIQTTLLLISTDQQLDELKMQTGERMLVQLIEEVKLPLLSKDKVSLSVLTGRYTSENNVASLTVRDIDDNVLLQAGQAQLLGGDTISRPVIMGDTVIGKVDMTLRDTSNGEIIASQWIFILGSFITHLLIWLIYGYIARPTRAQLAKLSRDVQERLIAQQKDFPASRRKLLDETTEDGSHSDAVSGLSVQQALNQYIKSHQDEDSTQNDQLAGSSHGLEQEPSGQITPEQAQDVSEDIDNNSNNPHIGLNGTITTSNNTNAPANNTKSRGLMANRPLNVATVQIHFYDPNNLMATLAAEKSKPYFALCTQLLERTIDELLKQPLLFGITLKNQPVFDENGARVEFTSSSSHSKLALAAMMLAKAYVMLNQVTYIKHRELQRFALEVSVGVSDDAATEKMAQLLKNNAKENDILVLLPVAGIKQLNGQIQLDNLKNPTTVYERDCASLHGVSESMMDRLIGVRNAVLLSATH